MLDMHYITEETLTKVGARKEDKEWWLRNVGSGYPVSELNKIEGDYNTIVSWLKQKFCDYTYDENGNKIAFNGKNGYTEKYTYDKKGNLIFFLNSNGYHKEWTYDERGNIVNVNDSFYPSKEYKYTYNDNYIKVNNCVIPLDFKNKRQ